MFFVPQLHLDNRCTNQGAAAHLDLGRVAMVACLWRKERDMRDIFYLARFISVNLSNFMVICNTHEHGSSYIRCIACKFKQ